MKIRLFVIAFMIAAIGLTADLFSAESAQKASTGQDLAARISRLEAQVQKLQKQLNELEKSKFLSQIPLREKQQGAQIPPDAKGYAFNGQKIWVVPAGKDNK